MKKQFFSFLTLIVAAAMLLAGCGAQQDDPTTEAAGGPAAQGYDADGAYSLGEDLYITALYAYSGPYVEDGSDEACEAVAAVCVENRSAQHIQYLRFTVETAGGTYSFAVSTLFSGAVVTALDENKTAFSEGEIRAVSVGALAAFTETPSVHLETLSISYTDGFINVKNLTDAPLSNVYVYYKNVDDTGYFGGITYRAFISELDAGALQQTPAAHITKDASRVVFVTYGE